MITISGTYSAWGYELVVLDDRGRIIEEVMSGNVRNDRCSIVTPNNLSGLLMAKWGTAAGVRLAEKYEGWFDGLKLLTD